MRDKKTIEAAIELYMEEADNILTRDPNLSLQLTCAAWALRWALGGTSELYPMDVRERLQRAKLKRVRRKNAQPPLPLAPPNAEVEMRGHPEVESR